MTIKTLFLVIFDPHSSNVKSVFYCPLSNFQSSLKSLPPVKFFLLFLSPVDFFKINFFEKFFQEYHLSVRQIRSRSGLMFCWA